MKKVLVLTAVLCLAAAMSPAAILECWVTVDNTTPNIGQTFNVSIWLQVVPDPSKGETAYTLSEAGPYGGSAIESCGVSVYQRNPAGNYSALPVNIHTSPNTVLTSVWNTNSGAFDNQHAPAARTDTNDGVYDVNGNYVSGNGDFDALQASGATLDDNDTFGVSSPVLLCTESWTCLVKGQAQLLPVLPYTVDANTTSPLYGQTVPACRYWNYTDPEGDGHYKAYFSGYEIGSLVDGNFVNGAVLTLNAPTPEPATLALLGFGAVATLLRRKNKK